jgi:hypothetical protein
VVTGDAASHLPRSRRVALLLAGIVAASGADLAVSLVHLRTLGLVEANPIAVFLVQSTGSALVLSAYKAATVLLCVGLLYRLRRRLAAEAAAWCAIAIMAAMSVQWVRYMSEIRDLGHAGLAADGGAQVLVLH